MTIAGWKFIEFMIWKRSYYKHVTLSVLLYDNSTGKSIYTNRRKEEIHNNLRVIFPLFDFPKYYPLFLFSGSRNGGWTVPFKVNIKLFFLCVFFVFTLFCWIFFLFYFLELLCTSSFQEWSFISFEICQWLRLKHFAIID